MECLEGSNPPCVTMARTLQDIIDNQDELAKRFEDHVSDPDKVKHTEPKGDSHDES